jgi:hypothetical protein
MPDRTSSILQIALLSMAALLVLPAARAAETMDRYFAHKTVEDEHGVIAPWYRQQNGQLDYRIRIAAETFRRYEWVGPPKAAGIAPGYAFNNTWSISPEGKITLPDIGNWYNAGRGQGSARAILAWTEYYRYTGDPAALAHLEVVADTLLKFSQTSASHPWPNFLISVPVKGVPYKQASEDGWIQLDIVGEAGVALLRAYQLTGNKRWLDAVKHWADVFVAKRDRTPGAAPWGRYANPEKVVNVLIDGPTSSSEPSTRTVGWGDSRTGNIQTAGLVYQLAMFDELLRLGETGAGNSYVEARDAARAYFRDTLLPAWIVDDTWGRGYWDWEMPVQGQTMTDWAVRYMMDNPEYFPNWKRDARNILTLFFNRTSADPASKGEVYSGAWAFPESSGCCGSSLAWGPMEFSLVFAQYGALAKDEWAKEHARRMAIIGTYDVHDTGVVEDNIDGGGIAADGWTNGAVPSVMKWSLRTIGWMPEVFGAARENHIVRSSAVVNAVVYGKGKIDYSTFDAPANTVEVLRLAFAPQTVTADGRALGARTDLNANGYTVEKLPVGDYIVGVRHDGATKISMAGDDPQQVADDGSMKYSGKWQASGSVHTTSAANSAVEFTFTGNQVRLLGSVGPRGGIADVYIDGVKQLVHVDLWNPRELQQQTVYYRNGLTQGEHTLRIVTRQDRNPLSRGNVVAIDAALHSAAQGDNGFGAGGGSTATQRMIFGYTGRTDYVDRDGNAWRPGTEFVVRSGSMTDTVAHSWWTMRQAVLVAGTRDEELYRYGVHARDFVVNISVAPGTYFARLKFAENQFREAGRRAVTILLNDQPIVSRMDVWATAAKSEAFKAALRNPGTYARQRNPVHRAVDLVFNDIKPRNGIIELRFRGEDIEGIPTEAILQALEIGLGKGGTGDTPVSAAP